MTDNQTIYGMPHTPEEIEKLSLELLAEAQVALQTALRSVTGKVSRGIFDQYKVHSADHVNNVAEGYIYLRLSGRFEASKQLIRTAIEVLFRLQAIAKRPELLIRFAWMEDREDRKWIEHGTTDAQVRATTMALKDQAWSDFKQKYTADFPSHPFEEKGMQLKQIAEAAGLGAYYDSHYALYCRFAHAAFSATTGGLTDLQTNDNRTVAFCVIMALGCVNDTLQLGLDVPGLFKRLDQLPFATS